jgi:hypothetical protein
MLEKSDSNRDGKVSFEDFYSVMIKDIYWFTIEFHIFFAITLTILADFNQFLLK